MKYKILYTLLITVFFTLSALLTAQETAAVDTSEHIAEEGVKQEGSNKRNDLEGPINYEAVTLDNFFEEKKTVLVGDAKISYTDIQIEAAKITVDWENSLMIAESVLDSVWQKNEETGDSVRVEVLAGMPVFMQGTERHTGEHMIYNFETKKAFVVRGRTTYEDGFYHGEKLKMVDRKTAYVENAMLTTCDHEDHPHFHFRAKQMKIQVDDKVIAKPIVMYIGNIPVLALPFVYFPIEEKGRHSGILFPRYGSSEYQGRYLRGLGYYWAASEYWDIKGTVDYFEKRGFLFRGDFNYNVRYKLSGRISATSFFDRAAGTRSWDLNVSHNQTLSRTAQLQVSGTFASSSDFYRQHSDNINQRLRQQLRSNATLTKQFSGSRSMTVNLNRTQNLVTDEVQATLPRIQFRGGQFAVFKPPVPGKGETAETRWYHNIYLSYSSLLESNQNKVLKVSGNDSTFYNTGDTGWQHTIALSSPQRFFGVITASPNMGMVETWSRKRLNHYWDPDSNRASYTEEQGFFTRRTFNTGVSLSTKLYGMFSSRYIKNVIVRHVMTPSISFNYTPDFTDDFWGYYDTIIDSAGQEIRKDRYNYEGAVFRGTPAGGAQSMSFRVNNVFQMKTGEGDNEKKFDLFSWNVGTAYNWKAVEYNWSNINSSVQAQPFKNVSLTMNAAHSFYQYDESDRKRVNRTYVEDINWTSLRSIFTSRYIRLLNFSADLRIRLSGSAIIGGSGKNDHSGQSDSQESLGHSGVSQGDRLEPEYTMGDESLSWDFNAALSYRENRQNPQNITRSFSLDAGFNLDLTENWRVSWQGRVDLMDMEVVQHNFVFRRDLHCWEAMFSWSPIGLYKQFYFRINVKSPTLQDLKYERGRGRQGVLGSPVGRFMD